MTGSVSLALAWLKSRSAPRPWSRTLGGELTYIDVFDAVETGASAGNQRTNREAASAFIRAPAPMFRVIVVILGGNRKTGAGGVVVGLGLLLLMLLMLLLMGWIKVQSEGIDQHGFSHYVGSLVKVM